MILHFNDNGKLVRVEGNLFGENLKILVSVLDRPRIASGEIKLDRKRKPVEYDEQKIREQDEKVYAAVGDYYQKNGTWPVLDMVAREANVPVDYALASLFRLRQNSRLAIHGYRYISQIATKPPTVRNVLYDEVVNYLVQVGRYPRVERLIDVVRGLTQVAPELVRANLDDLVECKKLRIVDGEVHLVIRDVRETVYDEVLNYVEHLERLGVYPGKEQLISVVRILTRAKKETVIEALDDLIACKKLRIVDGEVHLVI